MDLISIVVPVYNVEKYVEECLNSISKQNYKNIEVIIVNDGSLDSSLKICEKFCKKDKRFQVFSKVNGGLSSARNYGLEKANGKYVCFIDSDDVISKYYLSDLYNAITSNDCDIALCGYKRFSDKIPVVEPKNDICLFSGIDALNHILYQNNQEFLSVSACTKLFKREIFDKIRFPQGRLNEDLGVVVPVFEASDKIVCVYNYNYFYRVNLSSITNQSFHSKKMDVIDISENIVEYAKSNNRDILSASIHMLFCRSIEVLSAIYAANYDSKEYKNRLTSNIKKYRFKILFDKNAKKASKLACVCSLFGTSFLIKVHSWFKKRKRV